MILNFTHYIISLSAESLKYVKVTRHCEAVPFFLFPTKKWFSRKKHQHLQLHIFSQPKQTNQPFLHCLKPWHIESESGDRQIRQGDVPGHRDGALGAGHEAHCGGRGHRAGRDGGFGGVQGVPHGDQIEGRNAVDVETVGRDVGGVHLKNHLVI